MCCNCSHSGQTCGSTSLVVVVVVVVVVSISPLVVLVAVLLLLISSSSLIVIGVNSNEQARSIVSSFKICKASQYTIDDLVLVVAFPNVVLLVLADDDDDSCSTGITLCLIPEDDAMWNGFVLFVLFVVVAVVVVVIILE